MRYRIKIKYSLNDSCIMQFPINESSFRIASVVSNITYIQHTNKQTLDWLFTRARQNPPIKLLHFHSLAWSGGKAFIMFNIALPCQIDVYGQTSRVSDRISHRLYRRKYDFPFKHLFPISPPWIFKNNETRYFFEEYIFIKCHHRNFRKTVSPCKP